MTHDPRTKEEIYNSLRNSLKGKITKLRNFTDRSFNYVWTQAHAEEVQELEAKALVAELAGWIDYTGKDLTTEDLEEIGVSESVDADQLNEFMQKNYLDEYVKIVGISRFDGQKAVGSVTIDTQNDQTTIPKGTTVSTEPDTDGNVTEFQTTEKATTANGVTSVSDVSIEASAVGEEYNVPAGEVVRFSSPPIGVRGVNNPSSITGGQDEESNEDLRQRAKGAVESSSLGGTTNGIKGYIRKNVDGVGQGDVIIDEFAEKAPPYADVIVDGGLDSEVKNAIDFSRPTAVQHNLIRPQIIELGWDVDVRGSEIDTSSVKSSITSYLDEQGIDENFYEDDLIRTIMEADSGVLNIDDLGGYIERVDNELFTYSNSQSDYRLDFTYESSNGSITVTDSDGNSYSKGADFEMKDQTGDGYKETLVWTGTTPNDGQDFSVDYDVVVPGSTSKTDYYDRQTVRDEIFVWNPGQQETFEYSNSQNLYELSYVPFDTTSSITDNSGDTYAEGTDYEIVDDSGNGFKQTIDWSVGGSTPNDGEDFTITYDQKLYETAYDIVETRNGVIDDDSGDTYNEDTDYQIVDYSDDDEKDAIEWLTNPAGLSDGDEFYFAYLTEGDLHIAIREKISSGEVTVTQV